MKEVVVTPAAGEAHGGAEAEGLCRLIQGLRALRVCPVLIIVAIVKGEERRKK